MISQRQAHGLKPNCGGWIILLAIVIFLTPPLAAAGGSVSIPPGDPRPTTNLQEGVLVGLALGNYTWDLEPGDYLLSLAADPPGLAYEANYSHPEVAPAPCTVEPQKSGDDKPTPSCASGQPLFTGASTARLTIRPGDVLALNVTNGTGRAMVARADLYDPQAVIETSTGLEIDVGGITNKTCTAYGVQDGPFHANPSQKGKIVGAPYRIEVAAPRANIVLFNSDLKSITHGHEVLSYTVDPNHGDSFLTLSICRLERGEPAPYAIHVVKDEAPTEASTTRTVDALPAYALVGILAALVWRRR